MAVEINSESAVSENRSYNLTDFLSVAPNEARMIIAPLENGAELIINRDAASTGDKALSSEVYYRPAPILQEGEYALSEPIRIGTLALGVSTEKYLDDEYFNRHKDTFASPTALMRNIVDLTGGIPWNIELALAKNANFSRVPFDVLSGYFKLTGKPLFLAEDLLGSINIAEQGLRYSPVTEFGRRKNVTGQFQSVNSDMKFYIEI